MGSLQLSREHGINAKMMESHCPICAKKTEMIALVGCHDSIFKCSDCNATLYGWRKSKPCNCGSHNVEFERKMDSMEKLQTVEVCQDCRKMMTMGVMLISVRDGESNIPDNKNPYRTGRISVITTDAARKIFPDFEGRVAFIEDAHWVAMGLPMHDVGTLPEDTGVPAVDVADGVEARAMDDVLGEKIKSEAGHVKKDI